MKKLLFLIVLVGVFFLPLASPGPKDTLLVIGGGPPFLLTNSTWADSVFNVLTPDERLGQLFMMAAYSNKGPEEKQRITTLITKYKIGGLIFMQGGPGRQISLTNYYQGISKTPLLIAIDGEWGLSMRLDSTMNFPRQQMLGAIQNDSLIYLMGKEIAQQCSRIGVNINFAPDVDINNNAFNPVIGDRSFGDNKYNVAKKGIAYMKGLQDGGVIACAKHFPGHGDTDTDSHLALPVINASKQRLDTLELFPFKEMITEGVGSIMVAHLFVPALDTTKNRASTLSPAIVTKILKQQLGFKGLIFTDAMNMKGVSNYSAPGKVDAMALLAGNDVLLFSGNVGEAIKQIKVAIDSGFISRAEIDGRVKKILRAKYWCGLNRWQAISQKNLTRDLNTNEAKLLKQQLVENALTLVRNKNNFIPLKKLDTLRIASVAIGIFSRNSFQEMLEQYAPVKSFQIDKQASKEDYASLVTKLKDYNLVIVSIHNMNKKSSDFYGITQSAETFIDAISQQKKTIITVFGSPYALKFFEDKNWLLECYNDESITQKMAAQLLFGGIKAKGKLSVGASKTITSGTGIITKSTIRLKYTQPEEVGVREDLLKKIDSIVDDAILERAFPGCQVLVAKDGKVIYQKSFGFFTYDKIDSVRNDDLYDLASITKIAATNMEIMMLYDEGKIDLNKTIGDYLPEAKGTNKQNILIKELLTHTAGLKPFIPFYKHTLDASGGLNANLYSSISTKEKHVRVTKDIYICSAYIDTMWQDILSSPLSSSGNYVYSDLDFYFLKAIAEKIRRKQIEELVYQKIYSPLGLPTMGYNPTDKFSLDKIVPSNYDNFYRRELIRGFVHDQGAAMLGGVGGHAGLFSSANDLAIEMQMLLNKGEYGGEKYFSPETVQKFTTQAGKICRRGLGFDKPEPDPDRASPCCSEASCNTYGHQGFTGTCVWTDPQYNLIFVFLSNRTFPDDENSKINSLSVRKNIQEAIYKAILNSNDLSLNK